MTADADGTLEWVSRSAQETRRVGEALGAVCRGGEVILLEGPLGAGKTVLAQGIAAGLDVTQFVTSPTFTLLKEYQGRLPLAHFDFYRVDPRRAVDLEFADYLGQDGVCVVEWASRVPQVEPADALWLELRYAPEGAHPETRLLCAWCTGPRHAPLLAALRALAGAEPVSVASRPPEEDAPDRPTAGADSPPLLTPQRQRG